MKAALSTLIKHSRNLPRNTERFIFLLFSLSLHLAAPKTPLSSTHLSSPNRTRPSPSAAAASVLAAAPKIHTQRYFLVDNGLRLLRPEAARVPPALPFAHPSRHQGRG
ncbi:hypothetical protein GBA52_028390 [Prunus armeniaca]|nr:hypothetical protein GBA52_028390 [Prunus armeniaca]